MKKKTKRTTLSEELENFLADLDSLLRATGDTTSDELKEMRDRLYTRIEEVKDSITEYGDDLSLQAQKSAKSIDREVHKEPWKAIGIGAAVGLLLGMVVARR